MAKFGDFCEVARSFADVADFLMLYIEEAHPSDGWAFDGNVGIKDHENLEQRLAAASILTLQNPPFPIVVDSMKNEANHKYGGMYERLYILKDDQIKFQGRRGPGGCFVSEVEDWLKKYKHSVIRDPQG